MRLEEIKILVRDIQSLISAELTDDDEPDIMQLAGAHEEIVYGVIERAESVADLLDRGLNDEAIQLAERAPVLADLAMVLDFAELPEWTCILADFNIAPVPEMPHETIAQLEDAYSTTADSKQLMQRFRSLSLARAPLADRISVLRRLSKKDPGNEQWTNGIETYETHRLKSIANDLKAARDRHDLKVVAKIDEEVNQTKWSVPVPPALKSEAQSAHRKLKQADALQKLKPVAESLSLAYSEFNIPQASQILPRFQALSDVANLAPDHEIMDVAGPAVEWIEGEIAKQRVAEERQQAIANLQVGLDQDAPLSELEQHYYKAIEHGDPIPQVLETRLGNKIAEADAAAKRKRIAVISGSVVGLTVTLAALVWFIVSLNFNIRVQKNVEQITQLLEDATISGNTAPLESRFDELATSDRAMINTPELSSLQKQLESLKSAEDGRIRSFNTLLATVGSVAQNPEWATLSSGEDALDEANELTKNENERSTVLEAKRKFDSAKASLRKLTDKQFTDELEAVRTLMKTVIRDDADSYSVPMDRLNSALELANLSTEVESQGQGLLAKLKTERDLAAKNRLIELDLAAIGLKANSKAKFETAIAGYIKKHSGSQRANELEDVQRLEANLWDGVVQWNTLCRELPTSLKLFTPEVAKNWLAKFEEFQKSNFPGSTVSDLQVKVIEAIARRNTSLTGSEPDIAKLFGGQFMRECRVMKLSDAWYYSDSTPEIIGDRVKFNYFENGFSDAAEGEKSEKTTGLANREILSEVKRDPSLWLAAQSTAAIEIDKILLDTKLQFEDKIQAVMGTVLNAKNMDSILRLLLIENILSIGSTGSAFIQQEVFAVRDSLSKLEIPRTADWVSPEVNLKSERGTAMRGIEQHVGLIRDALAAAINARDATFDLPLGGQLKFVGWIHRDKSDRWRISLNPDIRDKTGTDLIMLYLEDGNPKSSIVARTSSGETILTGTVSESLLREGRPVYVKSK